MQRRARPWRPGRLGLAGQLPEPRAVDVVALVVERHGHVERMPGRHDVGGARIEGNPVQRRMCLDEPPVLLGGKLGIHLLARHDQVIQPRRELRERGREFWCLEDQQCADHLHPRRPGLGPGADHDVAVPEREAEPPGAVLVWGLVAERDAGHPASLVGNPASSPDRMAPVPPRERPAWDPPPNAPAWKAINPALRRMDSASRQSPGWPCQLD